MLEAGIEAAKRYIVDALKTSVSDPGRLARRRSTVIRPNATLARTKTLSISSPPLTARVASDGEANPPARRQRTRGERFSLVVLC